jgi:large repetitive protein
VAVGDSYTVNQGGVLEIPAPGVLGNDSDVDSAALTAVLQTGPTKGALTLSPDGSFRYAPNAGYSGADSFTYKASDGTASSNTVTVSITVTAVGYGFVNVKNLPPAAGVTFKPSAKGTLVDFEWKFTSSGTVVSSSDAQPSVTITGPGGYNQTFTPANCAAAGIKFEYKADAKLWDFHWTPKNAAVGTYTVVVTSGKTAQRFPATGGFPVVFKN